MKGKRFNNFTKAVYRYRCHLQSLIGFEKTYSCDYSDVSLKDQMIMEFLLTLNEDTLYRSSEFNRQLRLRMKFYNLKWIDKNG